MENNKRKYLGLVVYAISFVFAMTIVNVYFSGETEFEGLAGGKGTKLVYGKKDGVSMHFSMLNEDELKEVTAGWVARGKKPVVLILGNSQSHSINQVQDGQESFPRLLSDKLASNDVDVIACTMPNANLQEMYVWFEFLKTKFDVQQVILPTFFDDLRENDVRGFFMTALSAEKFTVGGDTPLSSKVNGALAVKAPEASSEKADMAALDQTTQEEVENFLNDGLADNSKAWNNRPEVRGQIFNWLYKFRNTVLGISPYTVRMSIPYCTENNMAGLSALLSSAKANETKVLVYNPPICMEGTIPYDLTEYGAFKEEMSKIGASDDNITFLNLEGIVPVELWGTKESTNLSGEQERDFMHFQFKGHQILLDALLPSINENLAKPDSLDI